MEGGGRLPSLQKKKYVSRAASPVGQDETSARRGTFRTSPCTACESIAATIATVIVAVRIRLTIVVVISWYLFVDRSTRWCVSSQVRKCLETLIDADCFSLVGGSHFPQDGCVGKVGFWNRSLRAPMGPGSPGAEIRWVGSTIFEITRQTTTERSNGCIFGGAPRTIPPEHRDGEP